MIQSAPNVIPAIPEIFVLTMTCVILLVDLFISKKKRFVTFLLVELTLIMATVISVYLYTEPNTYTFYGMYIHDQTSSLLKILIYIISFFAFLYARSYIKVHEINQGEYYVLGLFAILGMMVLVSANNLLVLFMGLEISTLPIYAMVAMQRNSALASEAAMKYFVMGGMASAIMLYGMSLLYGVANSLNLVTIANVIVSVPADHQVILILAIVLIVVGLFFKFGAAPFHMWVPDVYQGAPTPVTLFITSAPKLAALGMTIRLLVDATPSLSPDWQQLLILVAVLSMAIGNMVAIVQTNIKRMLAYSSIAHMGYMSLGLLADSSSGYAAAMFYMLIYAIMSMGAFAVIIAMSRAGFEAENINDLRGLNSRNPWLAFMMLLIMFSMAGIPPMAGFFAKLGVLEALVQAHFVWLAAVALIFAVIGSYYYLAIVKVMYFEEPVDYMPIASTWDIRLAITINSLAVLFLGLFPTVLIDLCRNAIVMS